MLAAVAAAADASTLPAASDRILGHGALRAREAGGASAFAWPHSQMAVDSRSRPPAAAWALFAT